MNEVHLYLRRKPELKEALIFLSLIGFKKVDEHPSQTHEEPSVTIFQSNVGELPDFEVQAAYFDGIYQDSSWFGTYDAQLSLKAGKCSNEVLDYILCMFITRYGGYIHYPWEAEDSPKQGKLLTASHDG